MSRTIDQAIRDLMAALPEVVEVESHGSPTFRVAGKQFASYTVNFHGDGRVALWLQAPPGAQFGSPAWKVDELLLTSYRHFALKRMLNALELTHPGDETGSNRPGPG